MPNERLNGGLLVSICAGTMIWALIIYGGMAVRGEWLQRRFERLAAIEFELQVRRTCPQLINYGLQMDLPECVETFLEAGRK